MAELVYAFDLKSNGEIHMGSSPISGTNGLLVLVSANRVRSGFRHRCATSSILSDSCNARIAYFDIYSCSP